MAEYLIRDIARILGKPPRTIKFWADSGLVIADIEPSQGKGRARVFSGRNLLQFAMVDIMVGELNVHLTDVKDILNWLRKGSYFWGENGPRCEFEDFFENPQWGLSKELVYEQSVFYASGPPRDGLHAGPGMMAVIEKDKEGMFERPWARTSGGHLCESIIWLGSIKIMAMDKILS